MKQKIFDLIYLLAFAFICGLCGWGLAMSTQAAPVENNAVEAEEVNEPEIKQIQTSPTSYIVYGGRSFVDEEEQAEEEEEETKEYLGRFIITHYCACKKCCGKSDGITATGTTATANRTIAVDPAIIPYGTHVMIDGIEYVAEDCGGHIDGKRIDIFCDSHKDALDKGVKESEVWLVEK